MRRPLLGSLLLVAAACLVTSPAAFGQLNSEQRSEVTRIARDIRDVPSLLRKKEVDEAEKALDAAVEALKKIAEEAKVDATEPNIARVVKQINTYRGTLLDAKATQGDPVSFESTVAPLLTAKCGNCHGGGNGRPQGGLNLATFAGLEAGGASRKPLVAKGSPDRSLLMAKLTTNDPMQRMPKNQPALSPEELETIYIWIAQGAKFDGKSKTDPIGSSGEAAVEIPKADGSETVSFSEDIAPFFSTLCLRCHNGAGGRSGFSVATFRDIMKGGDSGRVVLPGNLEGSRLFRLVGGLENPRMPNDDQARITKQNYDDLRTWILEGAKFDGADATRNIRQLVPSADAKVAEQFAKMTAEELFEYRKKRTAELWSKALPKSRPGWAESKEVYVYGSVGEARLTEVAQLAEKQADALRKVFNVNSTETLWKGKLAIVLTGDRFDFDEFVIANTGRRAPRTMTGLTVVTPTGSDAYVLLEDTGDDDTGARASLRINVIDFMTGAFLERKGGNLPEWVARGTGLAVAAADAEDDPYIASMRTRAKDLVSSLAKPEDVFAGGTFQPGTVGPVGFTLVEFMIANGGGQKYGQFLAELQSGKDTTAAMRTVYKANLRDVATGYLAALAKSR
jgi:hypothetical protein